MKRSQFGLLLFLLIFLAFIPKDRDSIERIIGSLQKWIETNPQEKVYLIPISRMGRYADGPGNYKVVVEGINAGAN
jgi:hypothetical protein